MHEAVGRLVSFLVEERVELAGLAVPDDPAERWALARSLMNMRLPRPVPVAVLEEQDAVLRALIARAGVTDASALAPVGDGGVDGRLALWRGDITTLAVDAIVNAANSKLLGCFIPGHHCIDNAIHTFAGMQLRLVCDELMRAQGHDEPVGRAQVTSAFNLPSRFVVHTVGPQVPTGEPTAAQEEQLASCYRASLDAAAAAGGASHAVCCKSTGGVRLPRERAPPHAGGVVCNWCPAAPRGAPTAAPMAVAVSAKPMTSRASGYLAATWSPRAPIISRAAAGLTGMCLACRGLTSR